MDDFERGLCTFGITNFATIWIVSILAAICELAEINEHWGLLTGLLSMPVIALATWLCLKGDKKC